MNHNLTELYNELLNVSQKLQESERLKSEFLSNIRNEINNPITSLVGLSHFLMQNAAHIDRDQLQRTAFLLHSEMFHMSFQMQNIIIAAELEAGSIKLEPGLVDLKSIIQSVISSFEFKALKKRIILRQKITLVNEPFFTDSFKLYLILMNLMANAIEFTKNDSQVWLIADKSDHEITLEIRDEGHGINANDQQKIFERFVQLDHGSTKKHIGHGLGLSIIKELVELLNGKISLTSELNEGSTFKIVIPAMSNLPVSGKVYNEFIFDNDQVY